MQAKNKRILLITGSLLLIGGVVAYLLWRRKKEDKLIDETKVEETPIVDSIGAPLPTTETTTKPSGIGTTTTQPIVVKPITYPANTKLAVRPPLIKATAYDKLFRVIGNISSAIYKGDLTERWMVAQITIPKGTSFETKTVYLLKKDWIKA